MTWNRIEKLLTQNKIHTLRNTIGKIKQMLHWNRGNYPINEVQPVAAQDRQSRRRRTKLNSVAPSNSSNNIQSICNNSTVCDVDSDEEKTINGLRRDDTLHIWQRSYSSPDRISTIYYVTYNNNGIPSAIPYKY